MNNEKVWFILSCNLGKEKLAKLNVDNALVNINLTVKRELNIKNDMLGPCMLNSRKDIVSKNGRIEEVETVMKGYIFLGSLLDKNISLKYISVLLEQVKGLRLLNEQSITETELKKMFNREVSQYVAKNNEGFHIGDKIKVVKGPFEHLEGEISLENKVPIEAKINLFSRKIKVLLFENEIAIMDKQRSDHKRSSFRYKEDDQK